ncbi:MAG TPA: FAD-binding oxidoreductase [Acidimicrobiales bacterium]|nr:FAD-binding oxidoreductase [Acidimicrobiales bacterium]
MGVDPAFRDIVGTANVLDDPELTRRYVVDWTGRFGPVDRDAQHPYPQVVRPGSKEESSAVVALCRAKGIGVVPQGGNTGLVGGSVPFDGEIVLSLERMTEIEDVNTVAGQVTAQAGAPLAAVQTAAREAGWEYGVDISARDSATIGGNVATNAGGLKVVRYGDTRHQLVGVEFVSGTGDVVSALSGTLRDNTGYHLPSLLCGSEGTLGVVTRVCVRLVPLMPERATALLRFADERAACLAAESLRRLLPTVESVELFFEGGVELVCEAFGIAPPFDDLSGGYVLVEAADVSDPTAQLAAAVESLTGVSDVAVANDSARRAALWQHRDRHTEAISRHGIPHKLDVAVPPGSLAAFISEVRPVVERVAPGARVINFGHAGEAAVHVNVLGPAPDDYAVDDAVLALVAHHGGSISAEHGIGRAKVRWLNQPAEEQRLRRGIKSAFDPDGIMNPGVLVP